MEENDYKGNRRAPACMHVNVQHVNTEVIEKGG